MDKESHSNKKKIEFSKIITTSSIIIFASIAVWSMVQYYQLIKLAIENNSDVMPDSALPVACVGTILGAIISYCLYQGALKTSLNKNHLTEDNITGEIKDIANCEFLDAVDQRIEKEKEKEHSEEEFG